MREGDTALQGDLLGLSPPGLEGQGLGGAAVGPTLHRGASLLVLEGGGEEKVGAPAAQRAREGC